MAETTTKMTDRDYDRLKNLRQAINSEKICGGDVYKEAASLLKTTIPSASEVKEPEYEGYKHYYRCFLSGEIMVEPVVCSTGQTYEKTYIKAWMDVGFQKCPKSHNRLDGTLRPNEGLKQEIKEWKEEGILKNMKEKLSKTIHIICSDVEFEVENYKEALDALFALSLLAIKKKVKRETLNADAEYPDCPAGYRCPISQQIMVDPVLLSCDGQTYDRQCIEAYVGSGRLCPVTHKTVTDANLSLTTISEV